MSVKINIEKPKNQNNIKKTIMQIIKNHKGLASHIAGKKILLMNSLGKDSILCLDWLHNYAKPSEIHSLNLKFMAPHPDDEGYLAYLNGKYPNVHWHSEFNPLEISKILLGFYQLPTEVYSDWNHFEYDTLDYEKFVEDWRKKLDCDFVCYGESRYESFARATQFHKRGIVQNNSIFPLGMMSKEQVFGLIRSTGIKLHPQYNLCKSTLDKPSYYKMRSTFIAKPEYKKAMYKVFPLLALDEYRYERLLK